MKKTIKKVTETVKKVIKGFKAETLKKVTCKARKLIDSYKKDIASGVDLKVSITTGNRKIGRVLNVSLMPIVTCANCKECMRLCYDIKACLQYPNVIIARCRNTAMALFSPDSYFEQIENKLSRRKTNKFFRWHVGGDIPSYGYFSRMVDIAKRFPDFTFWTYTKNYNVVNLYCTIHGESKACIPENLSVMFSRWDGMPMDNPYGFGEFCCKLPEGNVDTTEEEFSEMWQCPGNCEVCILAKRGCITNETSCVDAH